MNMTEECNLGTPILLRWRLMAVVTADSRVFGFHFPFRKIMKLLCCESVYSYSLPGFCSRMKA